MVQFNFTAMVSRLINSVKSNAFSDFKISAINGFSVPDQNSLSNKFHTLIFIKSGQGNIKIDFEEYTVRKSKVLLIGKYRKLSWLQIENIDGLFIQFTDNFYNQIYTGHPKIRSDQTLSGEFPPIIRLEPEEETEVNNLLDVINKEYTNKTENSREIICLCLKALIMLYRRKSNLNDNWFIADRKKKLMDDFTRLLNSRFAEFKTPKEFAGHLNISPNYLNAVCKEVSNKTVSWLIQERIVLEAKRLLTHTAWTVSEISFKLGFKDNSYFGRYFKKAVGMSPERFRTTNYRTRDLKKAQTEK